MPCSKNVRLPKTKTEISANKIKIKYNNSVLGENRDLFFNIKFIEQHRNIDFMFSLIKILQH